MRKASFRPNARKDIRETAIYLAVEASEAISDQFQNAVQDTADTVANMPGIGTPCSFDNPRLKDARRITVTGFENWLVFYIESKYGVEIVRVLHGARDIAVILDADA